MLSDDPSHFPVPSTLARKMWPWSAANHSTQETLPRVCACSSQTEGWTVRWQGTGALTVKGYWTIASLPASVLP